jgi:hypothetical protein
MSGVVIRGNASGLSRFPGAGSANQENDRHVRGLSFAKIELFQLGHVLRDSNRCRDFGAVHILFAFAGATKNNHFLLGWPGWVWIGESDLPARRTNNSL